MSNEFHEWLDALRARRQRWVDASHENDFDRGIWNATVEKYADPSHFLFELLQNAEDASATWVRFTLEPDRIIFEHDGRSFDRDDIKGVTGIGNTTKLNDGHKIGCFGIGFKSVYVLTDRPEVHSFIGDEPLAFAIEDLVVPTLIPTEHSAPTTRIVLPLRPDRRDVALSRTREGLIASGARSLLFLRDIRRLDWIDGATTGSAEVSDGEGSIRSITTTLPDGTTLDRFLILTRQVEHEKDQKQYEVKAALRLNSGGELIAEASPTRLMVFFETEETTGLHFTIHGPFQLTDNRGNIKRDDAWNTRLVGSIASMVADALPDLRDRGLLKRSMLDLLPNGSDELPPVFAPILDKIIAKFGAETLLPCHAGGFTRVNAAVRGPADLRDLLGNEGLAEFGDHQGRHWIISALRNSRADAFITTLMVEEWGFTNFLSAFRHVFGTQTTWIKSDQAWRDGGLRWFNALSDEQVQLFYLALDSALKIQKHIPSIADYKFVRLEDGSRHSPRFAVFAPADNEPNPQDAQNDLFLVRKSLLRLGRGRGKEVEQFLRRAGVRDIDERAYLSAIIRSQYKGDGDRPNRERHLQHMRRFVRWWKETEDSSVFSGVAFIRAGSDAAYRKAEDVHLGPPFVESGLSAIYDGSIPGRERVALWEGYKSLPRKDFLALLEECDVEENLTVRSSKIPYTHPHLRDLKSGWGSARHTSSGADVDYRIDQLAELLARKDPAISRLVWNAARAAGAVAMTARYSPNQTYTEHQRPSSLGLALRDMPWIPTKDGTLAKPATISSADLGKGFTIGGNEDWLRAIGFGEDQRQRSEQHKARKHAGDVIGLSPELVEQLINLTPEALAALSADMIRTLNSRFFQPVAFPEKETSHPTRRAERLAARAQDAPVKNYEVRDRSVRISNGESRILARTYLADHYTNHLGEMVCQGCHAEMPFKLPDGSPYFVAAQCLDTVEQELAHNYLALCPTCAAKWRHANPLTDDELRLKLSQAADPEISIDLAGEAVRLRFTKLHLDDLRAVTGIGVKRP